MKRARERIRNCRVDRERIFMEDIREKGHGVSWERVEGPLVETLECKESVHKDPRALNDGPWHGNVPVSATTAGNPKQHMPAIKSITPLAIFCSIPF
eukprot:scaffold72706_cov52-Attheya_sp.AAC.7